VGSNFGRSLDLPAAATDATAPPPAPRPAAAACPGVTVTAYPSAMPTMGRSGGSGAHSQAVHADHNCGCQSLDEEPVHVSYLPSRCRRRRPS